MEAFAPPFFLTLDHNNTAVSKDGKSTPVCVQQNVSTWIPSLMPQTPAKQRRTVHGTNDDVGQAQISNNQRCLQGGVKGLRKGFNSRKRACTELSQFSALQLEDTQSTVTHVSQDCGVEPQSRRCRSRSMGPPFFFPNAALFPSQRGGSPKRDWLPLVGRTVSHVHLSPDEMDFSQADTEYSNFFGRRILTEYREIRELGSGFFGKVTLCEETSTGNIVAIKTSPPLANHEQRQRFMREKAILTSVRGFPHVVQLFEAWEEGRVPQMYLQMEFCKGGSVAQMAESRRRNNLVWEEKEVFVFIGHMALALDALHSANIVHMDFKPDNVLIDENGDYKLSDFGCSVVLNEEGRPRKCFLPNSHRNCNMQPIAGSNNSGNNNIGMTEVAALSMPTQPSIVSVEEGDCRYLCSDMLNQKLYLREGDMFSFGISLFELMSGEPLPQQGVLFLELRNNPPMERLAQRGYSGQLIHLVAMLMHNEPTARPTARDVLCFFQLPPQASSLVTQWAAATKASGNGGTTNGDGDDGGSEQAASTLLEMRYLHAALEVASRLVYITRRTFGAGWPNNTNKSGGGGGGGNDNNTGSDAETQQQQTHFDDFCTPNSPVVTHHLVRD